MPPIRNVGNVKPTKTVRTHEENQERAYIAASRRSDRSLEARVESARRASEIHKKRTGRALRIRDEDVINEEMYEEEDDDLPAQYRRLTAHLQTNSMDFNRRFHAYIQTQAAMRSMDPSVFIPGYVPPFSGQSFYPQYMQPMGGQSMPMSPHMMVPNQQAFGQSTFPSDMAQNNSRMSAHQRAASLAPPLDLNGFQQPAAQSPSVASFSPQASRRMSMPTPGPSSPPSVNIPHGRPELSRAPSSFHSVKSEHNSENDKKKAANDQTTSPIETQSSTVSGDHQPWSPNLLASALPPESQMILGPTLDQNDRTNQMYMAGSQHLPMSQFYSYNPNLSSKSKLQNFGMSQTLSPRTPHLDTSPETLSTTMTPSATTTSANEPSTPFTPASYFSANEYADGNDSITIAQNPTGQSDAPSYDWFNNFVDFDTTPGQEIDGFGLA